MLISFHVILTMVLLTGVASIKKKPTNQKTLLQSNVESEIAFPKKKRTKPQKFSRLLLLFQSQDI